MRRRRRAPPERGWDIQTLEDVVLAHTSVDNVGTICEPLWKFEDLIDQDEESILNNQDRVAEYWLERLHVCFSLTAAFAGGNALGAVPVWVGLFVGDSDLFDDISGFPGLLGQAFWSAQWRQVQGLRNIVRVHPYLSYERYGVESSDNLTSINNYDGAANPWFKTMEVKNLHLKRGEGLYLAMSQTGLGSGSDSFQAWTGDGDAVRLDGVVTTLVRKKRGQ